MLKITILKILKNYLSQIFLFGNIILENLKIMRVKKFVNFSTVWENYDGKKDNYYNLYSAYKIKLWKNN